MKGKIRMGSKRRTIWDGGQLWDVFFTMGSIWEVSFGMVYLQCEIWKRFSPVCWPTFSQVLRSLDGLTVVGLMGREGRKICTFCCTHCTHLLYVWIEHILTKWFQSLALHCNVGKADFGDNCVQLLSITMIMHQHTCHARFCNGGEACNRWKGLFCICCAFLWTSLFVFQIY